MKEHFCNGSGVPFRCCSVFRMAEILGATPGLSRQLENALFLRPEYLADLDFGAGYGVMRSVDRMLNEIEETCRPEETRQWQARFIQAIKEGREWRLIGVACNRFEERLMSTSEMAQTPFPRSVITLSDDEARLRHLPTPKALFNEGNDMDHCLWTLYKQPFKGKSDFLAFHGHTGRGTVEISWSDHQER